MTNQMTATNQTLASILQTDGAIEHYHVPKYQREYTWGKNEWEQMLADIEENNVGYFMGSVICVDDNAGREPGASRIYEVVDGQQRLTTLSIILMSVYRRILELKDGLSPEDEEENGGYRDDLSQIAKRLVYRKREVADKESGHFSDQGSPKHCFLRVQPSIQRNNFADYRHILESLGLIHGDFGSPFCGVRRLYKAYEYFYQNLPGDYDGIKGVLDKFYSLSFVHISVTSSADAFVLFESLNNRGIPLSAIDIIKNKMLANLEKNHEMRIDDAFGEWQKLLEYLPEYKDQERFLRQYYNAFKIYPHVKIENFPRAIKSTLIKIYEKHIENDAKTLLKDLLAKAEIYDSFLEPEASRLAGDWKKLLLDLGRIGAAPAYLFLLYLRSLPANRFANRNDDIKEILEFFVKYYVRRNITDFPNTRDLDTINISVIEKCHARTNVDADFVIEQFMNGNEKPAKLSVLKEALEENLFYYNAGMARFVLARLVEMKRTNEFAPDMWERNAKGGLVWTVEHIFPQGENIPSHWVDMIADGDKGEAKKVQRDCVHKLGNLTLSGYNAKLGNKSFKEKQDLRDESGNFVGYKNGLYLNKLQFSVDGKKTCLADIDRWTEDSIKERNDAMVNALLKEFAFDDAELAALKESGGA